MKSRRVQKIWTARKIFCGLPFRQLARQGVGHHAATLGVRLGAGARGATPSTPAARWGGGGRAPERHSDAGREPRARAFYEIEAARESWSTRELERQVASLLYERVARSRDADGVLALAKEGQRVAAPGDVLKDPVVLEFLELEERPHWLERDLELATIDRRQREEWEAATVGIVLCSEKNDAMVRITLPEDGGRIHTARYQLYLPTEEELREEVVVERGRIEQARRRAGVADGEGEGRKA